MLFQSDDALKRLSTLSSIFTKTAKAKLYASWYSPSAIYIRQINPSNKNETALLKLSSINAAAMVKIVVNKIRSSSANRILPRVDIVWITCQREWESCDYD